MVEQTGDEDGLSALREGVDSTRRSRSAIRCWIPWHGRAAGGIHCREIRPGQVSDPREITADIDLVARRDQRAKRPQTGGMSSSWIPVLEVPVRQAEGCSG